MWYYFYPHFLFHLTRWFPKNNRIKFRILAFIISVSLLVPEFYVLLNPKSTRACDEPLLSVLVATTIFLFFSIGFGTLFTILDPVSRVLNIAFQVYGVASCFLTIVTTVYTLNSPSCAETVPELYYWSYVSMILSLICTGYFVMVAPFWIFEAIRPRSILDMKAREGLCYEPVMCCSCLWHV